MQTRITDQPAFILHRRDYKESSLILEIFSEQFGRVSVLAKAAKKRRDASHFQICNRLLVGWSGRSELKTLTQIESRPLALASAHLPGVFYINELLLYLLPKHQPQSALFQQYQMFLLHLAQCAGDATELAPALRNLEIDLLQQLGLMPDLSQLTNSTQALQDERLYRIDRQDGVCEASSDAALAFHGKTLKAIAQRRFDQPEVAQAARRLLRQLIDYNLQGRTLQSRKFYQQLKSDQS